MNRKAVVFQQSADGKRCVAVDEENAETLLAYITQDARHEKKFRHIVELILNGLRNTDLYDKEEINDRAKGVTAMKLFKGQENAGTPDRPHLLQGVYYRQQDLRRGSCRVAGKEEIAKEQANRNQPHRNRSRL